MVVREEAERVTVGRRDEGGVPSCLGEPSGSASRLLRGSVAYLSAVALVALTSATVVNRGPFAGHLFSSLGEFGVRHRAVEVLVGFARNAGLSRTRFGKSAVGRIRGLGVSGRGFSGGVGFSRLLARSRVARLGPRGAVTGRGAAELTGELRFGSATLTLTRRRGRGGAPASDELSEPQPEPQDTTLEAHDLDPPPLESARPQPSTPLSLPAAPRASSSPAGKLSRSPNDLASSLGSTGSCSMKGSLGSGVEHLPSVFTVSTLTLLSTFLFSLSFSPLHLFLLSSLSSLLSTFTTLVARSPSGFVSVLGTSSVVCVSTVSWPASPGQAVLSSSMAT